MLNNLLMRLKDLIKIKSALSCYPQIDLQLLNKSKLEIHKSEQILERNSPRSKINLLDRKK